MSRIADRQVDAPADKRKRLRRRGSALASPILILILFSVSLSQPPTPKSPSQSDSRATGTQSERGDPHQSSSREAMLRDVEVKRREAIYKENLERAREGALLGAAICDTFQKQKHLGQVELKKLGRIEKLAKNIRNDNGGDDDEQSLKEPPKDLSEAVTRLARMSVELKEKVEKTPKHVVSTSVITAANQLLELIRLIRTLGG